jgi:hypothetical protein
MSVDGKERGETQGGRVRRTMRRRPEVMCVVSAKTCPVANSVNDMSVGRGYNQGATHIVPALLLEFRLYGRRLCGAERILVEDAGGDQPRPSHPASVKDPGSGERGRDEVCLGARRCARRSGVPLSPTLSPDRPDMSLSLTSVCCRGPSLWRGVGGDHSDWTAEVK